MSNSKRLREASRTIREYLESRYLKYLNVERTGKMYGTIVGKSDDDEDGTEPRGIYQRIGRRMPGLTTINLKVPHNAAVH